MDNVFNTACVVLLLTGLMACEANKTASTTETREVTQSESPAKTRAPAKTKAGTSTAPAAVPKRVARKKAATTNQPAKDTGKAIATILMETMTRRDIKGAKSLFPRAEFLAKHFPGKSCQAFRDAIASKREGLFSRSRAWVKESISRILHPSDWKEQMTGMKDEIATSLGLRVETVSHVTDTPPSLGKARTACKEALESPIRRYRATYHAEILDKSGTVQLDGDVMNLAKQGWFVVGY